MLAIRFLAVTALVALALRVSTVDAAAPLSPMVDLNTDSASNVLLNGTNVKVWYDSANDGSTATQQDFGQNTANSQPAWVPDQPMPNGINRTLIDFRGGTTNGTASTAVDYLTSKIEADARITDVASTFNRGGDSFYLMNGVSWFSVFRTDNNAGGGTGSSQVRQAVWSNIYATPNNLSPGGFQDAWATTLSEAPDADDDIVNFRNNSLGDPGIGSPEVIVVNDSPVNVVPNAWYIVGNAWDATLQTFKTRILQANTTAYRTVVQNVSVTSTAPAPNAASGYSNNYVRIGESSNSAGSPNTNREFNGEMAELLLYNHGLSASEFDTVMSYLEQKFFLALPGDFNLDHFVDAADYVEWRKNFGSPYTEDDYTTWRTNFGASFGSGSGSSAMGAGAAAVPEPVSSALIMMAFVILGVLPRTIVSRMRT